MSQPTVSRPAQSGIPVLHDMDVIVMGGGPGGVGAAIGAARNGAKTLLIERYGFLGGMATAGHVNPWMPNHHDGKPLDTGVFQDWCRRIEELGGMKLPARHFCPETAKLAAEQLCLEASVQLLYHAALDGPLMDGQRIDCVLALGKSGLSAHRAKVFVDATGDADLAARAGCPFEFGREQDGAVQPMTSNFDLANVDVARIPDRKIIQEKYEKAKAEGRIRCPRENVLYFKTVEDDRIHFNTTRIVGANGTDTLSFSAAEVEGRRQIAQFIAFLRAEIAGFENARLHSMGAQIGVRETRRIRGHAYLTRADYERAAKYPDGICRVTYPIDIHNPAGTGTEITHLPKGEWYEIPYGCLVPQRCENLLVGGRPISVDHAVHSSMRVMPPACTIGQACGAAAALCARDGLAPAKLDGRIVKRLLIEQGVALIEAPDGAAPAGGTERKDRRAEVLSA
ncbi:MAG: FAD-dependent oxidoreductase [Planctomycetota bacterium]|nr:FAD-dependent oxidoreductase [Planctomycetota bacterium]